MIRPIRLSDCKQLTDLYNHYVSSSTATFDLTPIKEEDIQNLIRQLSGQYPFLIEETKGTIHGYCYAHPWKSKAAYCQTWETTIYLAPQCKGKGIGKALMRQLIEECKLRGCQVLIADITSENIESCRFHEALGFKQVSHFRKVGRKFERWLDVIDYQLILSEWSPNQD